MAAGPLQASRAALVIVCAGQLPSWRSCLMRTFTRGWFENESIWLHMSYKYLLELLRTGLASEFFTDAQTMLVPFMNPHVYGRSVLENCSFLASSANPDPTTRGRGFIARLSGSTAEFIQMWLWLTAGRTPFFLEEGQLRFRLQPRLPAAWFARAARTARWRDTPVVIPADALACALFGSILLVYHNPARADCFGPAAARPVRYLLDQQEAIDSEILNADWAERIRRRTVRRLDVWLEGAAPGRSSPR